MAYRMDAVGWKWSRTPKNNQSQKRLPADQTYQEKKNETQVLIKLFKIIFIYNWQLS